MSQRTHEIELGSCSLCKSPPIGVNQTVYVTKGGNVFQNDPNCEWLVRGQDQAFKQGKLNHPINSLSWGEAAALRGACESCCPLQWTLIRFARLAESIEHRKLERHACNS